MARRKINKDTVVYSAAIWWSESDPFANVIATTFKKSEAAAMKMMRSEAVSAYETDDQYSSVNDALDQLHWSGVHSFALKDLATGRELEDTIRELSDDGVAYLSR